MEVQLRKESGALIFMETLKEAVEYAKEHPDVWKISFPIESGERVRMIRTPNNQWQYEPIDLGEVFKRD
jgi:hypothetical protein